jgi:hypothetical protein
MKKYTRKYRTTASNVAPDPLKVKYWIDLAEDPSGGVTKVFKNGHWVPQSGGGGGAVNSVNGLVGDVELTPNDIPGAVSIDDLVEYNQAKGLLVPTYSVSSIPQVTPFTASGTNDEVRLSFRKLNVPTDGGDWSTSTLVGAIKPAGALNAFGLPVAGVMTVADKEKLDNVDVKITTQSLDLYVDPSSSIINRDGLTPETAAINISAALLVATNYNFVRVYASDDTMCIIHIKDNQDQGLIMYPEEREYESYLKRINADVVYFEGESDNIPPASTKLFSFVFTVNNMLFPRLVFNRMRLHINALHGDYVEYSSAVPLNFQFNECLMNSDTEWNNTRAIFNNCRWIKSSFALNRQTWFTFIGSNDFSDHAKVTFRLLNNSMLRMNCTIDVPTEVELLDDSKIVALNSAAIKDCLPNLTIPSANAAIAGVSDIPDVLSSDTFVDVVVPDLYLGYVKSGSKNNESSVIHDWNSLHYEWNNESGEEQTLLQIEPLRFKYEFQDSSGHNGEVDWYVDSLKFDIFDNSENTTFTIKSNGVVFESASSVETKIYMHNEGPSNEGVEIFYETGDSNYNYNLNSYGIDCSFNIEDTETKFKVSADTTGLYFEQENDNVTTRLQAGDYKFDYELVVEDSRTNITANIGSIYLVAENTGSAASSDEPRHGKLSVDEYSIACEVERPTVNINSTMSSEEAMFSWHVKQLDEDRRLSMQLDTYGLNINNDDATTPGQLWSYIVNNNGPAFTIDDVDGSGIYPLTGLSQTIINRAYGITTTFKVNYDQLNYKVKPVGQAVADLTFNATGGFNTLFYENPNQYVSMLEDSHGFTVDMANSDWRLTNKFNLDQAKIYWDVHYEDTDKPDVRLELFDSKATIDYNPIVTDVFLTQAEYDALVVADIKQGVRYHITDANNDNFAGYLVVPDYINMDTVSRITAVGGTWTVEQSGFVLLDSVSSNISSRDWSINGKTICTDASSYGHSTGLFPVKKGDVVKYVIDAGSSIICYYVPPLLVKKELPVVVEKNGSYSLEEIETADTWLDGKKIYKKTSVDVLTTSVAGTIVYTHSVPGVTGLIKSECTIKLATGNWIAGNLFDYQDGSAKIRLTTVRNSDNELKTYFNLLSNVTDFIGAIMYTTNYYIK